MPSGEVGDLSQVRNVGSVPLDGAVWVELMGFSSCLRLGGGRGGAYLLAYHAVDRVTGSMVSWFRDSVEEYGESLETFMRWK